MTQLTFSSVHETRAAVDAATLLNQLHDVSLWPVLFPPTIAGEILSADGSGQRIRLWAMASGVPTSWESTRVLTEDGVSFRQAKTAPQLSAMEGQWEVIEDGRSCTVRLHHRWELADPAHEAFVADAVDQNSTSELAALASAADRTAVIVSFEDSVEGPASAREALDLLWRGENWPRLLSHVVATDVAPLDERSHLLDMLTASADGPTHQTQSIRVLDGKNIRYKQLSHPAALSGHAGTWTVEESPRGCRITSAHIVGLTQEGVDQAGGLEQVEQAVRRQIGGNSIRTMNHVFDELRAGVR